MTPEPDETHERLAGPGVVLTRPAAAAEALAACLKVEGFRVWIFPCLQIDPVDDSPTLARALDKLDRARLAIFVSANAARHGLAAVRRSRTWPSGTRIAAIGDATAQALRNSGFQDVISPPERHDSDGLAALPELQTRELSGKDVVIFRGEGGRERLREILEARGARVTYAETYRRSMPRPDPADVLQALAKGEVTAVNALSAQTLENFLVLIGDNGVERLADVALVVPHEAIAAHPSARRFREVRVAAAGIEGLIRALSELRANP